MFDILSLNANFVTEFVGIGNGNHANDGNDDIDECEVSANAIFNCSFHSQSC